MKTPIAGMDRRTWLGRNAAAMGGALAGLALKPAAAWARTPNLDPPVVQVEGGKLRGFRDGRTTTFLGIPYAEAERFEPPKPVEPWDGVKNAQAWGPVCPIPAMATPGVDEFVFPHRYWLQNEHCQVLNVWTPDASRAAKRPVMVWMHGGGFTNGSSMEAYAYDGKGLSEFGDVVVVSLNHRLNILGTLDLSAYGREYAESRYTGTADLLVALQWIQANIEGFGGDPGNVTLFGQSGGGSKVSRMMHTPAARGLFHKAICQSGGGDLREFDPATKIRTHRMVAAATLANLNLGGNRIDELGKVPYPQLLAAGEAALQSVARELGESRLAWEVIPDDRYVTRELCDWANGIPLVSGNAFSEQIGTLHKGTGKNEWTQKEIDERLEAAYGERKDEVVAEFRRTFPRKKVQDVLYFAVPRPRGLLAKVETAKVPSYCYNFAYEYPVNGGVTAFHCSEIAFAFHNLGEPHVRVAVGEDPAAFALQDKVAGAWVSFARTGNPSQPGLEWRPFTPSDPQTMIFDSVSECRSVDYGKLATLIPDQASRRR